MTRQTCALLGCNKPPWPSVAGSITPPLTCGNLHHQLLMATRFNPSRPHPFQAILHRNAHDLCALLSCENPPCSGHSWCSRSHYLLWLTEFTASLHPDQICKLPRCTRHVFVDDNAKPWQFCGWKHRQKFVMLTALDQRRQQEALPAMKAHPQEPPLPATAIESECGLVPSLNSHMHSLKQYALRKIPPKNITVMEDFYEKHPWEVFTEGHACLLIARLKFTSKGRKLTTKGHYHWKQSGPRDKKSELYTTKYYTYMKRKGHKKEGNEELHGESSYTIKERTMEGVKWYSLIEFVSSHAKLCKAKEQPRVEVMCSQDLLNYDMDLLNDDMDLLNDDDMSRDSVYRGLSPLSY